MPRVLIPTVVCAAALVATPPALGDQTPSVRDRVEELQQELDSLTEEIEDLQEPVAEFELFDQCMYLIGVTEYGTRGGAFGYAFGPTGTARRPALALDIRGFRRPRYQFLAFPAEEPPSIECNEDAGQESTDD
jgi:hypothetical protein